MYDIKDKQNLLHQERHKVYHYVANKANYYIAYQSEFKIVDILLCVMFQCDELRDVVTEEYWPWISQYLVMKRASIELNFHVLYSNFLDVLKVPEVNIMVLKETYRNIRVSSLIFSFLY